MIRVLLADDHGVIRDGLGRLIGGLEDVELVGTASDGAEAVEKASRLAPDVVVMDLDMPRVDGIEADPRCPDVAARLWERAGKLVPRERPGDFNSALMELGATICTPRSPRCPDCPVRRACKARAAGAQDRIPAARARKALPLVERDIYRVRNAGGEFLIEQARRLASRVDVKAAPSHEARIKLLYRHVFQREPLPKEVELATKFLQSQPQPAHPTTVLAQPSEWQCGYGIFDVESRRLCILDVEGLPYEGHWHVIRSPAQRLSPIARSFVDFAVSEAPRIFADREIAAPRQAAREVSGL
jgi:hypothetical protein